MRELTRNEEVLHLHVNFMPENGLSHVLRIPFNSLEGPPITSRKAVEILLCILTQIYMIEAVLHLS